MENEVILAYTIPCNCGYEWTAFFSGEEMAQLAKGSSLKRDCPKCGSLVIPTQIELANGYEGSCDLKDIIGG